MRCFRVDDCFCNQWLWVIGWGTGIFPSLSLQSLLYRILLHKQLGSVMVLWTLLNHMFCWLSLEWWLVLIPLPLALRYFLLSPALLISFELKFKYIGGSEGHHPSCHLSVASGSSLKPFDHIGYPQWIILWALTVAIPHMVGYGHHRWGDSDFKGSDGDLGRDNFGEYW